MIKVIACDMDGTLLNGQNVLSERTIRAIKNAQEAGIRFMIVTGRGFDLAMEPLGDIDLECDYILSSGAEVRNPKKEIVFNGSMDPQDCRAVYNVFQKYELTYLFTTDKGDYCIGTRESYEKHIYEHLLTFNQNLTETEIREMDLFKSMNDRTKVVCSFEKLEESQARIIKIHAMSNDLEMLAKVEADLFKIPNIAVASSFENNLEITDAKAQKGPVLKEYIESLGYTMEEVMVFGDSMNDFSMLSMDFGATVAMENGAQKVKEAAKYITKSNLEDGVAYAIEELLKNRY